MNYPAQIRRYKQNCDMSAGKKRKKQTTFYAAQLFINEQNITNLSSCHHVSPPVFLFNFKL